MLIDSHAHLDSFVADGDWPAAWDRAREAGVERMVAIGGTVAANTLALQTAQAYEGIDAVLGYDRDEAGRSPDLALLDRQLSESAVVGVGETGLDYHYSADTADAQCALLEAMLDLSIAHRLPVVIHTREAEADTLRLLQMHSQRWAGQDPGVIHCFTGDAAFAAALLELGYLISFSGIVTFKNADTLRQAARVVPLDRMLIETDAPYLAPVPLRGKRNEPAFVVHVARFLADWLGVEVEQLAAQTSANAVRLFQRRSPA
jgi:TatD DNase family protein